MSELSIFILIYIVGIAFIYGMKQKKILQDFSLVYLKFSIIYLFGYFLRLELFMNTCYFFIPLIVFSVFLTSYKLEKRRLFNGMLFNLFVLSVYIYIALLYWKSLNTVAMTILELFLSLFMFLLVFGVFILILFFLWNGTTVLKKETHSLSNSLTLIISIVLSVGLVFYSYWAIQLPIWAATLVIGILIIMGYFFAVLYNFLTISLIYHATPVTTPVDFIIVLGSGLINGRNVPPLLKSRIKQAIKIYKNQIQKGEVAPKIVMSGGQGKDEDIAESIAMKQFAIEQGISGSDILTETQSKNTYENMVFSKKIMDKHSEQLPYQAVFTTNNYHVFRAALIARKAHLKIEGIGSHTAFYFLPNAFLREFIAIIAMNKTKHVIISTTIMTVTLLLSILMYAYF